MPKTICGDYDTAICGRLCAAAAAAPVETGSGEEPEATQAPLVIQDDISESTEDDDDDQDGTTSHRQLSTGAPST